ncbi:hypothetical protein AAY473_008056 [Plecturocebus cupreus]
MISLPRPPKVLGLQAQGVEFNKPMGELSTCTNIVNISESPAGLIHECPFASSPTLHPSLTWHLHHPCHLHDHPKAHLQPAESSVEPKRRPAALLSLSEPNFGCGLGVGPPKKGCLAPAEAAGPVLRLPACGKFERRDGTGARPQLQGSSGGNLDTRVTEAEAQTALRRDRSQS